MGLEKKVRIGVFINAAYSDYGAAIIEGVSRYCRENDCTLIVFPVLREAQGGRFNFQYDAMLKLINPNNFDVLIVCSATFVNFYNAQALIKEIHELPPIPKISIGLDIPDIPSLLVDSTKAVSTLVEHIINKHNRHNFLLMNAGSMSMESNERSQVFFDTLKKNKIRFSKDKILCGHFNFKDAYNTLEKYIKSKKKLNFDAIFCCNDDMALGCIGCLEDNGIHVPEDVSIIGYDNVFASRAQDFGISTVDQLIEEQGYKAAKLAEEYFLKKTVKNHITSFSAVPIIRHSCGCKKTVHKGASFADTKKLLKHNIHFSSSIQVYMIHYFLSESQTPVPLEKLYSRLAYCFELFDISSAMLFLYDKPVYVKKNPTFVVPEKAVVKMTYTSKDGIVVPEYKFNPSDDMLPEICSKLLSDGHFIFPVYAENNQYGYLLIKIGKYEKIFYQTVFELVTKEIIAALKISQAEKERAKLKTKNITLEEYSEKLQALSRTDEMTQILNRRGFIEDAQAMINRFVSVGKSGLVIFGDMDGLKSINDTFGHEAGDRAIKAEADILSEIFRTTDIVGRLGGDEFAILAPEMTKKDFAFIKKRLATKCQEYNDSEVEPFVLSMSIGCTEFSSRQSNLDVLLNEADQKLYAEKRLKKEKKEAALKLKKAKK